MKPCGCRPTKPSLVPEKKPDEIRYVPVADRKRFAKSQERHKDRRTCRLPSKCMGDRYGTRKPSRRELRIIELVAQGLKNCEIADKLGIGQYVVRNYLSQIYDKIGLSNRVELALWYEARMHEGASLS